MHRPAVPATIDLHWPLETAAHGRHSWTSCGGSLAIIYCRWTSAWHSARASYGPWPDANGQPAIHQILDDQGWGLME